MLFRGAEADPARLIECADSLMYQAKAGGKGRFVIRDLAQFGDDVPERERLTNRRSAAAAELDR